MRNLLILVFGVIPACSLCFFVLPVSVQLIGEYLDHGDPETLLMILWCAMAVFGTFALVFSLARAPGPVRMVGLACGITAMYTLDGFYFVGPSLWSYFFVGPVVTAMYLIGEGLFANASDDNRPNDWTYPD